MNIEETLSNEIVATVEDTISISACLWFFTNYYYLKKKTIGLQMILTLSVADFIFHISNIFTTWCKEEYSQIVGSVISNFALRFSILWSTNIAFFLHRLLKVKGPTDSQKYYTISLIVILTIASALAIVCRCFGKELGPVDLGIMAIVTPISLILTTLYYLKSIAILKEYAGSALLPQKRTTKVLYLYAFVQLLTVGPIVIYSWVSTYTDYSHIVGFVLHLFVRLTGFANAMVYFFQRVSSQGCVKLETGSRTEAELSMTKSVEDVLAFASSH